MKSVRSSFTLCSLLTVVAARGDPPSIPHGPPESPLAWQEVDESKARIDPRFSPSRDAIGSSLAPTAVNLVELRDTRPYGLEGQKTVWLARYESVPVWLIRAPEDSSRTPDSSAVAIPLNLAFDAATNELVCAFTDPAPEWAVSRWTPPDIEALASHGCEISRARYEDLHSTVPEVLRALYKVYPIDPSKAGQIVVRPRFTANRFPAQRINGDLVPKDPPCNVWIVEVLGTFMREEEVLGENRICTTLVVQFRDRDLMMLFGQPMF